MYLGFWIQCCRVNNNDFWKSIQFPFLFSTLFLLHSFLALSQDIIFGEDDKDATEFVQKLHPKFVNFDNFRSSSSSVNLKIDSDSDSKRSINCVKMRECMTLDKCPNLFVRLQNPSFKNLQMLQNASCGFTLHGDPLVWCEPCDYNIPSNDTAQLTNEQRPNLIRTNSSQTQPPQVENQQLLIKHVGSNLLRIKDTSDTLGLNPYECGTAFPGRISGGENTVKGEFPWAVAIAVHTKMGPQIVCGGALITDDFVVTAAHCVADASQHKRNISHVRIGAYNISRHNEKGAENIAVSGIYFHEGFRERPVIKNDIALLKLKRQVTFGSTIGAICVPNRNESENSNNNNSLYAPNSMATIVGWGSDGRKSHYSILQKASIPIVSGEICKRKFRRVRVSVIPDTQICAGEKGLDSCKGDSGGPLSIEDNNRHILIGVISFGTIKCDGRLPGVYTKISSYIDWIHRTIILNS